MTAVEPGPDGVEVSTADGRTVRAGHVFSTVPLPVLARLAGAPVPPTGLAFRAMVLVYLVHAGGRWTGYDAHYLPGPQTRVTRLSEPANYRVSPDDPADRSVLCAEIPCAVGDPVWTSTPDDLAELVRDGLRASGLPGVRLGGVEVRRLPHVYPVYEIGYADRLRPLDEWVDGLDRVTTFGRLGLFAHDNTHHAMAEALDAVAALRPDGTRDPGLLGRRPRPVRHPRRRGLAGVQFACGRPGRPCAGRCRAGRTRSRWCGTRSVIGTSAYAKPLPSRSRVSTWA